MKTLLVLMDTLRRDTIKCYNENTTCLTPNLEKFSKDACIFDNHYTGSLPCMPARRDLYCGRLNFLERSWGPIEIFDETLPSILSKNNISNHIITDHAHYFRIGGENYCQQFDTYEFYRGQESDPWKSSLDEPYTPKEYYGDMKRQYQANRTAFIEEKDYPSVKCFKSAEKWIEENGKHDNFFLMVETFDPHEPYDVPDKYLELYEKEYDGPEFELPKYHIRDEPESAMKHMTNKYKSLVTMTDNNFGTFIEKLKEEGIYDDTMIIVTTDHGYCFGEKEFIGKNYMPTYNEIAHIPLMIHYPQNMFAGERRDQLTQNIDLMPTVLDYNNISIPKNVKGKSIRRVVEHNEKIKDNVLFGTFGLAVNIFDGKYVYMRAPRDQEFNYEYTTSLTTIRGWLSKEKPDNIESGVFLKNNKFPLYKVKAEKNAIVSDTKYILDDFIFDLEIDPLQEKNIINNQLKQMLTEKLQLELAYHEAPENQYDRLGLLKNMS